jgi:hypothetical protein
MKVLNWIAWISAGIGVLLILLAGISTLTKSVLLGVVHTVNYFHAANSFFLLAIALFVFLYRCECNKK